MSTCSWSRTKRYLHLVLFVCAGFCIGVIVNYYGLLFESIVVRVEVDVLESANTSTILRRMQTPDDVIGNMTQNIVPNIVHFIWFATDANKTLSFLNYMSMRSAHTIQKPEIIMLHCNFLPTGKWWERAWREIPFRIVHREIPAKIHGQTIVHTYHKGDVAKIEVLLEFGGIYLDYDVLVINSLDPFRQYDATLGKEKPPKFIAGIIVAKKNSLFLKLLYESYRNNYRPLDWDYNCARVAYQIYLSRPDLLHVEPYKFTTPDWQDRRLLWNDVIEWRHLYVIHVMGHFIWDEYTPENIGSLNSTFGEVMRFIYYGSSSIVTSSHVL